MVNFKKEGSYLIHDEAPERLSMWYPKAIPANNKARWGADTRQNNLLQYQGET